MPMALRPRAQERRQHRPGPYRYARAAYDLASLYAAQQVGRQIRGALTPPPPTSVSDNLGRVVQRKTSMRNLGQVGRIGRGPRTRVPAYSTSAVVKTENRYEVDQMGQAWIMHQHMNRDTLLSAMAEHLVTIMLNRMNSTVVSQDATPDAFKLSTTAPLSSYAMFIVNYHFLKQDTLPADTQEEIVSCDPNYVGDGAWFGKSFKDYVESFYNLLRFKHMGSSVLNKISVYRGDDYRDNAGDLVGRPTFWFDIDNIMSRRMNVTVRNLYKIQNITPDDNGTNPVHRSMLSVSANALEGAVYDFSTPRPRFRKDWLSEKPAAERAEFAKLEDTYTGDTYYTDCPFFRAGGVKTGNLLPPWRRPLSNVKTVFQSCSNAGTFTMKPGGFTTMTREFTFNGTFRQLALGMYGGLVAFVDQSPTRINQASTGNCQLMMFRHMIRNENLDGTEVKVAINHFATYTVSSTGIKKRKVLPRYISNDTAA